MKVSISNRIGMIVSGTLAVSLGIMLFLLLQSESRSKLKFAHESVKNLSNLCIKSITFVMAQGATDVSPYIQKTKDLENLKELDVIPVDKIKAGSEARLDATERQVLQSKKEFGEPEEYRAGMVFRTIEPILADESCTSCHAASAGEPLAVVSVRYSLDTVYADIADERTIAIILSIITIILTFSVSMYFIKRRVIAALTDSIDGIERLTRGDVSGEIDLSRDDELGQLNSSLHQLQTTMTQRANLGTRIARGRISDQISLLSDADVLGQAFITLRDSLKHVTADLRALTQAAIAGRLDFRINHLDHHGEFKAIALSTNEAIDALVRPVNEGTKVLDQMATGDLSVRVTGEYDGDHKIIKDSINKVAESLSEAISQVAEAIRSTNAASEDISSSAEQMAAGAQEQSAQTAEVASAVEEMNHTIAGTTQSINIAAEKAKSAGTKAREGGQVVNETIVGMDKISVVVEESAKTVYTLGENGEKIGDIVEVIDEIAGQTNLLALNAAIEAARAGEQGRGFAVVADEVRKLAERTTKATSEVATVIKQIQHMTNEAVQSMQAGTREVAAGKALARSAGKVLETILHEAEAVTDTIAQVAAASEQQSTTIDEVAKSIEAINTVTHDTATGIQQIARASEELNRLTGTLQTLVNRFVISSEQGTAGTSTSGVTRYLAS